MKAAEKYDVSSVGELITCLEDDHELFEGGWTYLLVQYGTQYSFAHKAMWSILELSVYVTTGAPSTLMTIEDDCPVDGISTKKPQPEVQAAFRHLTIERFPLLW